MAGQALPIEALPAWATLNDISFVDVKVSETEYRGLGLVCDRNLVTKETTFDMPTLVTVPHSLVLNAEAVEQYAKEDKNFRLLLDAAGHKSTRGDILLFLLVQTVLASGEIPSVSLPNPWTQYTKFLPALVPLPTTWTEDEQACLRGTSLESAVAAKLHALDAEFEALREASSEIACWDEAFWQKGRVSLRDWVRLDALYRSRVLELPRSGESMVPCLDMVNHSAEPTAYYEENTKDEVVLLLRPGVAVSQGGEVTISYGEAKAPAEMLFSYGFLDGAEARTSMAVLPLKPFDDDPLARAKLVSFGKPPQVRLCRKEEDQDRIVWTSPFAYLMCVNEEDGLDFRVLQDHEGGLQLRVFWQEHDVTERAGEFDALVQDHPLRALLELRVATVIRDCLQDHVGSMHAASAGTSSGGQVRPEHALAAARLRASEVQFLEEAMCGLDAEMSLLLADPNVVAYLGSTEGAQTDLADAEAANQEDEDDFS